MSSSSYSLTLYPDQRLAKKSVPYVKGQESMMSKIVDEMFLAMKEFGGVGLAANQIGYDYSLFVYDIPQDKDLNLSGYMLNPIITYKNNGQEREVERCLSIPGTRVFVPRFNTIRVSYLDMEHKLHTMEATGYIARVLQHEFDHLQGKTIAEFLNRKQRRAMFK